MNNLYLDSDTRATSLADAYPNHDEKRRYISSMAGAEKDDPLTVFAAKLLQREFERGSTQTEIAERSGLVQNQISQIARRLMAVTSDNTGPKLAAFFKFPHFGAFASAAYESAAVTRAAEPANERDRAAATAALYDVLGDAIVRVNAAYPLAIYSDMGGDWWLAKYLAAKADEDKVTQAAKVEARAKKTRRGKQLGYHREVAEARGKTPLAPASERPAKKHKRKAG